MAERYYRRAVGKGGPIRLAIARARQATEDWNDSAFGLIRHQFRNGTWACPLSAPHHESVKKWDPEDRQMDRWQAVMAYAADDSHSTRRRWRRRVTRRALLALIAPQPGARDGEG